MLGDIDAVLTGYLGSDAQVPVVLDAVERVKAANAKAVFVCDPVLGDDGKLFVKDVLADAMLNGLAPRADWLTPNAFELGLMTGKTIDSLTTRARRGATLRQTHPLHLDSAPRSAWAISTQRRQAIGFAKPRDCHARRKARAIC